jgi:hypothetical protein
MFSAVVNKQPPGPSALKASVEFLDVLSDHRRRLLIALATFSASLARTASREQASSACKTLASHAFNVRAHILGDPNRSREKRHHGILAILMAATTIKLSLILLVTATLPLAAQWLNYPDARIPHKKDGQPNLTAPAPRRNGKPDLSGVWQAERTPISEFTRVLGDNVAYLQIDLGDASKYALDIFWGLKRAEQPLRPEAVARMKQLASQGPPAARCLPGK